MENAKFADAMRRGFEIIKNEQELDGSFLTLSSSNSDFKDRCVYKTTFAASNILHALNQIKLSIPSANAESPEFEAVRSKIFHFLMAERTEQWSWNYWTSRFPEKKTMPYPDDWDDTAMALNAIYGYQGDIIDPGALGKIVKLFMQSEVAPGGPYYTWIINRNDDSKENKDSKKAELDIDLVVNSNIAYFLSNYGVHLTEIQILIENAINNVKIKSQYYPNNYYVAYAISRCNQSSKSMKILEHIFDGRKNDGLWGDSLQNALAILALMNLGATESVLDHDMDLLVERALSEDFAPHPFCADPGINGEKYWAGSRALTAALVMEAIAKFQGSRENFEECLMQESRKGKRHQEFNYEEHDQQILAKIKRMARERMKNVPDPLREIAGIKIQAMGDAEIVLVPYRTINAIDRKAQDVPRHFLQILALANFFGWMAYGIYDDILDSENEAKSLPLANLFLREAVSLYDELDGFVPQFSIWKKKLMNEVDNANLWEKEHCVLLNENGVIRMPKKFPDGTKRRIGLKSIAHALPAIGVSLLIDEDDEETPKAFESFFNHYLIARQLHDDAHDWKDDLAAGHLTPIVKKILIARRARHGEEDFILEKELGELQIDFWKVQIESIVKDIKKQTEKARRAIERMGTIINSEPLIELVDRLDRAAEKTLQERNDAMEFMESYEKIPPRTVEQSVEPS